MSILGRVGKWEFRWKTAPHGPAGVAHIEVSRVDGEKKSPSQPEWIELRWRRDSDGIWIELPSGVHGFDLQGEIADDGRPVFQVMERGGAGHWQGLSYLRPGEQLIADNAASGKKVVRMRSQMPGKILRLHIKSGDHVEKGQSLMVMEAMKMENEIRAPQAGVVGQVKVIEGQAVETGVDLCMLEPV
ncbi:biotin/lipoyl-containing protein [Bdellovibrionota bacterium FG-1]